MSKKDWIWMPHAGHLCVGEQCLFRLNTFVNGYIVSTVGEYYPSRDVRRINCEISMRFHPEKKIDMSLQGSFFDYEYLKTFGYEPIGGSPLDLYETMVFKAAKTDHACCPYKLEMSSDELDIERYSTAGDAYNGHLKMCEKWDKKKGIDGLD